jgi:1,4-alpha-glucan branching enzyme
MKNWILILCSFLIISTIRAQVIEVYPSFPNENQGCTIFFKADQGNQGLVNFSGDIYIHTGVVTSTAATSTTWQNVVTTWGSTNAAHKLTQVSANLYSFSIPNIRNYYNVTNAGVEVLRLAMVFRNASGNAKGANADGSDIFYDLYNGGALYSNFFSPAENAVLLELNDTYSCVFKTSQQATITLYDNNVEVFQASNTDSITYTYNADVYGKHWIKAVAQSGSLVSTDSFYFLVREPVAVEPLPANTNIGINYLSDTSVRLVLCAPNKEFVFVIGEFNNWQADEPYYMKKTPDNNYWWIELNGLTPGNEYAYQYWVDGSIKIADPYTDKVLDPWNDPFITETNYPNLKPYPEGASGIVSILQTNQVPYSWVVTNFVKPAPSKMNVYELLMREFIARHDFNTMLDTLAYLKRMGINVIKLMPVNEFEGNSSWGYNPSFYFAPDKYYGPKNDLKQFIDLCHQNGIAVLLDIALNHSFSQSPYVQLYWNSAEQKPATDNPWYNTDAKHPFNVGYDMNHESAFTKKFFTDVTRYWLREYKFDGYRFDLSKGFTQNNSGTDVGAWSAFDQSRLNIWDAYNDSIRLQFPDAILVLEHLGDNEEEKQLSNMGFLLWGNLNYNFGQMAMGFSSGSDVSWLSYVQRGWQQPHVVGYMESHDEERLMYKTLQFGKTTSGYSTKVLDTALQRIAMCANIFFAVPGPKMLWQFGELGYDYSIEYGGANISPKPIRWDYYSDWKRFRLYRTYCELMNLRRQYSAFSTTNFNIQVGGLLKRVTLLDNFMNVVALSHMDVVSGTYPVTFPNTGTWYEFYSGEQIAVTNTSTTITFKPGDYRLYTTQPLPLPDLGTPLTYDETDKEPINTIEVFPNPAEHQATIRFQVSVKTDVQIHLYDLNGRFIRSLFQQNDTPPGVYSTSTEALNLTQGIYLIEMQSGGTLQSTRLVVH